MADYGDNHLDVIRAKAEAKVKIIEARAKLHPAAQVLYTFLELLGSIVGNLGCLIVLLLSVLLLFSVDILSFFR